MRARRDQRGSWRSCRRPAARRHGRRFAQPGLRQRQRQLELADARAAPCSSRRGRAASRARGAAAPRARAAPAPTVRRSSAIASLAQCLRRRCSATSARPSDGVDAHEARRRGRACAPGSPARTRSKNARSSRLEPVGARAPRPGARRRPAGARSNQSVRSRLQALPCTQRSRASRSTRQVEAAAAALVGEGRVGEAVAQHDVAARQRRLDHLRAGGRAAPRTPAALSVSASIGACSTSARSFSASGVPPGSRVHDDAARRAARSALGERLDVGRLAGAVDAFEGDEEAASRRRRACAGSG